MQGQSSTALVRNDAPMRPGGYLIAECSGTSDRIDGKDYRLVNVEEGSDQPAFDHQALATALSAAVDQPVDPNDLPLSELRIDLKPLKVRFVAFGKSWTYSAQRMPAASRDKQSW